MKSIISYSILITVLGLAPIIYMRDVYGPILDARSAETLLLVTAALMVGLTLSFFLTWIRSQLLAIISVRYVSTLSPRVIDATIKGRLQQVAESGYALQDLQNIRSFISSPTMEALVDAPLGVFFLALVFLIHPLVGAITFVGACGVVVVGVLSEKYIRPKVRLLQATNNSAMEFVSSSFRNSQIVRAMGIQHALFARWDKWRTDNAKIQTQVTLAQAAASAATKCILLAQGSLILGVGVALLLAGIIPGAAAAGIVIAKILAARAIGPTIMLINSWKQIDSAKESFERLKSLLRKMPETEKAMRLPPIAGHLVVEKLMVRAPGTKANVVSNVSFTLKQGSVMVVVGPTGAGKSSLVRALVGIWRPLLGSVRVDGVDISTWDSEHFGSQIGYLSQEVDLLPGSLIQNIARFGIPDQTKIEDVVRITGLRGLIERLPKGLESTIDPSQTSMSGGERQRIALARALYGSPKYIVLDEPNSNLDALGEELLVEVLREMRQRGATIVVISHRPSMLCLADRILVMSKGFPKMYGTRDEVLKKIRDDSGKVSDLAIEH
jgi:ATP-binding cassette subfamily C exporter for protease/lipase